MTSDMTVKELTSGVDVVLPDFTDWWIANRPSDLANYHPLYQSGLKTGAKLMWVSLMEQKIAQ